MSAGYSQARVWVDGREVRPDAPVVSAMDRGFLYGWAVFETLRIHRGRPAHRDRHAARLRAACRVLGGPAFDARWVDDLAHATRASGLKSAAARVALTAGASPVGLWSAPGAAPRRLVWIRPVAPLSAAPGLGAARTARPIPGLGTGGLKTHAYVGAVAGRARAAGADEVLWVGPDGCVAGGAMSNLFAVLEGRWVTPPAPAASPPGVRAGVTRDVLLESRQAIGAPVVEQRLTRASLASADEVFITSSVRGVTAIGALDGRPVGRTPGVGPAARWALEAVRTALDASVGERSDSPGNDRVAQR